VAAPKRPARRKSSVQYNEQEPSELSDDGQDSGDSPPPRKRARGKSGVGVFKAKKKGKGKQIPKFLEMPLDVMFEVSGILLVGFGGWYLWPLDPQLRRTQGFVAIVSDVQGPSRSHHEQIVQVCLAQFLRRGRRGAEMPQGYFRTRLGAVVI